MSHRTSVPSSLRSSTAGPRPGVRSAPRSTGTSTVPSSAEPSAAVISASPRSRRLIRAAVRWPSTATRKNSSAPPATSCVLVGGASPAGRAAAPMTTMFFASSSAGSACLMVVMASRSAVRSFSSSVRVCTLSTVSPGSVESASSLMRRLVSRTDFWSAASSSAAPGSAVSFAIRVAYETNSPATWSESRCARSGDSAVPEILMMLPSVALAPTRSRRSLPLTPAQPSLAAARSTTTELVATSVWVSSSRSSHVPGSSTDADVV